MKIMKNISIKTMRALVRNSAAVIGLAFVKTGYLSTLFGGLINLNMMSLEFFDYKIFLVPIIFTVVWYVTIFNSLNWSDGIP